MKHVRHFRLRAEAITFLSGDAATRSTRLNTVYAGIDKRLRFFFTDFLLLVNVRFQARTMLLIIFGFEMITDTSFNIIRNPSKIVRTVKLQTVHKITCLPSIKLS